MGPPEQKIVGMFSRIAAIIIHGTILPQLGMQIIPSTAWAETTVLTCSTAIASPRPKVAELYTLRPVRDWARRLKRELHALYLAYRDPRTPRHARFVAAAVVGYAFSPIDLIPDFIPVLGYLDDAV